MSIIVWRSLTARRNTYFVSFPIAFVVLSMTIVGPAFSQCQFAIVHANNDDHCLYAREAVVWSKTGFSASLTQTFNSVNKSGGTDGWNAGAVTVNSVKDNGWATTVINETNKYRAFGLSTTDGGVTNTSIQYSFSLRPDGILEIYEGSTFIKNLGSYVTGKTLKIAVENGVVKYYYDGQLKHSSGTTPTLPLLVDISLYHTGATIESVEVVNGSNGTFLAQAPVGDLGAGPTYQWYLNGVLQPGETASTYTNTSLTAANSLYCRLTPGAGGCSGVPVNSNTIQFQIENATRIGDFTATNTPAANACFNAREEVHAFASTNVAASGNDLVKNYGATSGSWDAGAFSTASILNNGSAETTVAETNTTRAFGLSSSDVNLNLSSIQFGFYFRADGLMEIYESNSNRYAVAYSTGQTFKVAIEDGIVKYYRNGTLLYISTVAPVTPLHVDVSFQDMNATMNDIFITNGTSGSFTAIATEGPAPSYAWTVGGTPVGGGSALNYSTLTNGDVVRCTINPNRTGCANIVRDISLTGKPFSGRFYISATPSTLSCASTEEDVTMTDLVGVTANANLATKFQGGSGFWNAGATSLNQIFDNGYAETTVLETNTTRIFGVSTDARASTHSSATNSTIQYGIMLASNSRFYVYELESNGTTYSYRGDYGSYSPGSVFSIKVDNGIVRYYHGTTNFFSSPVAPTLPLVVDVSFQDNNATLDDIVVSNGCTGVFSATVSGAGASPSFQWQVGGVNAGTNSATFSTSTLSAGSIVSCILIPDIVGCSTGQNSNQIIAVTVGGVASPTTTWTGAVSTVWENASNWSNGRPSGYLKVVIPNGRPRYPSIASDAGVYDVTIQSGASLDIAANKSLTVFNAWNNQGAFTANSSLVTLRNCTNNAGSLQVGVTGNTFYDLNINNGNGLSLQGTHSVGHQLTLTSGIVTAVSSSDVMVINDDAIVSGGSAAAHVAGKVRKIGNNAFSFPLGKSGSYRPLSINAPALDTDAFEAEYFKAAQPFGTSTIAGIWSMSGCEYWILTRPVGTSNVKVTLSWVSSECDETLGPYVTDPADLTVLAFNGTTWIDWGNTAASGTTSGSITSNNTMTSFTGPVTLGSWTRDNVLPVELVKFEASNTPLGASLTWVTLSELNSSYFEVERAGHDLVFSSIGKILAAGTTNAKHDYRFLDNNPANGLNYYRLRQVDVDHHTTYSSVVRINFESSERFQVYPNPVNKGEVLTVSGSGQHISILDPITVKVLAIYQRGEIRTDNLRPGIYLVMNEQGKYCRLVVK